MKYIMGLLLGLVLTVGLVFTVTDRSPNFDAMVDSNVIVNGSCSGTYIGDNLILSAAHCFRKMTKADGEEVYLTVKLSQVRTGSSWKETTTTDGTVQWIDTDLDLALVRIEDGSIFTAASLCYRRPELGEVIYHMGNPAGQEDTLLKGLVSKEIRRLSIGGVEREYFQTNAGVVGGSSGGALYDSTGCLVGVVSAGIPNTLIGAGVPIVLLPSKEKREGTSQ